MAGVLDGAEGEVREGVFDVGEVDGANVARVGPGEEEGGPVVGEVFGGIPRGEDVEVGDDGVEVALPREAAVARVEVGEGEGADIGVEDGLGKLSVGGATVGEGGEVERGEGLDELAVGSPLTAVGGAIPGGGHVEDAEPVDSRGRLEGGHHGDLAAHRVAEEGRPLDLERVERGDDVGRHLPVTHRRSRERVAVVHQVDADDSPRVREGGSERGGPRPEIPSLPQQAVEDHQWRCDGGALQLHLAHGQRSRRPRRDAAPRWGVHDRPDRHE
mmetsp:Transcript_14192/g.44763  ORF Transcript_14192/g.44763 Transcript_14192/m.44763 type:complete len:272 (-) Transcript_14192:71-886(-)